MKKHIFVAIAAACMMIGTGASAQNKQSQSRMMKERPTAEQVAQHQTARLKEKLALTDKQAQQIYDYNLQQVKELQKQREQMRAARQAEVAKMKSILTPEQFEKWQKLQGDNLRGRGPKAGKPGAAGKGQCCNRSAKGGKKACGPANGKPHKK